MKTVPPPRSEPRTSLSLKHHGDELGLYTEQEERYFDHVSNLKYYREQITSSLIYENCEADAECDLNPLPGSRSYSLSKLEKETKELIDLGPYEYFLQKVLVSILQAVHAVAVCGGLITAAQWIFVGCEVCY